MKITNSLQIINIHKKNMFKIIFTYYQVMFWLRKIIFKINENAYTLLDYEKRINIRFCW